jgi:hypothetical protein
MVVQRGRRRHRRLHNASRGPWEKKVAGKPRRGDERTDASGEKKGTDRMPAPRFAGSPDALIAP